MCYHQENDTQIEIIIFLPKLTEIWSPQTVKYNDKCSVSE